jgi:mono/diheme cytochrome c family protein
MRIEVFLDDERAPRASFEPPGQLELDTSDLADGPHVLRVRASAGEGSAGNEEIPFVVRNGPGIAVVGLRKQEVVRGRVPILVNAYESRRGDVFEPGRVETPAPIPTWTWVLALVVMTWAMWYAASEYRSHADTLAAAAPGAAAPASAPASAVPSPRAPSGASAAGPGWKAQGAQVFGNYCSPCHQLTGQGLPGVFPPLAGSATVKSTDPSEHLRTILQGLHGKTIGGVAYTAAMPPFGPQLNDAEVAAVVNHERSSWGNEAPLVRAEDVAAARRATSPAHAKASLVTRSGLRGRLALSWQNLTPRGDTFKRELPRPLRRSWLSEGDLW